MSVPVEPRKESAKAESRSTRDLAEMKQRLRAIRRASLAATQRGDFRAVGKLTGEASELNQLIQQVQGTLLAAA